MATPPKRMVLEVTLKFNKFVFVVQKDHAICSSVREYVGIVPGVSRAMGAQKSKFSSLLDDELRNGRMQKDD
ncbi:hypothetical protein DM860_015302 [Cuscuta australis]|uniref:Uncharacterized protein n=1 Tax=Cuscuta australis TaxID=267555 RepID=A0A328DPN9_9ASTE|nr:hypothetical protein DM860_015302 [Cuscuta australis]